MRSTQWRNHVSNFSQSVQGLRSSDTTKLPFPMDLLHRPYNSVRTAVRHCDCTNARDPASRPDTVSYSDEWNSETFPTWAFCWTVPQQRHSDLRFRWCKTSHCVHFSIDWNVEFRNSIPLFLCTILHFCSVMIVSKASATYRPDFVRTDTAQARLVNTSMQVNKYIMP